MDDIKCMALRLVRARDGKEVPVFYTPNRGDAVCVKRQGGEAAGGDLRLHFLLFFG